MGQLPLKLELTFYDSGTDVLEQRMQQLAHLETVLYFGLGCL